MNSLKKATFGYVPVSQNLSAPGDRRRFGYFAKALGLNVEIANPEKAYDFVVVTGRGDLTTWRDYTKGRVIYDCVDPYMIYSRHWIKDRLRGLSKYVFGQHRHLEWDYRNAIYKLCHNAAAVVCAGDVQKQEINKHANNVHIILDVHEKTVRQRKTDYRAQRPFRIVWEGLPSSVGQLRMLKNVFKQVNQSTPIALHIITDPICYRYMGNRLPIETEKLCRDLCDTVVFHPWQADTFNDILLSCDLAVLPTFLDDPFWRAKSMCRLLLFWRAAMPVIAAATPDQEKAMAQAGIDLACATDTAWESALLRCIADEQYRRQIGEAGYAYVNAHYSREQILAGWSTMFESTL